MNVCLVNTAGETKHTNFVPLALLKLSTKHKQLNDNVELVVAGKKPKNKPDLICFSTIFGFKKKNDIDWINGYAKTYPTTKILIGGVSATLNYDWFQQNIKHDNYEIVKGLVPELDNLIPDYEIAKLDYSYGFTSRGCHRKCDWCCVPKIEGLTYGVDTWKLAINTNHKKFFAFDNNVLFMSPEHVESVLKYISDNDMKIEFNQAMDAELWVRRKKDMYPIFLKYKHIFIRFLFSWDSDRCTDFMDETMEMLKPFKTEKNNLIYMLYDFPEQKPESLFNNIQYIHENFNRVDIKPMRYINVDTGKFPRAWGTIGDLYSISFSCGGNMSGQVNSGIYKYYFKGIDYEEFMNRNNAMSIFNKIKTGKHHSYKEFFEFYNKNFNNKQQLLTN